MNDHKRMDSWTERKMQFDVLPTSALLHNVWFISWRERERESSYKHLYHLLICEHRWWRHQPYQPMRWWLWFGDMSLVLELAGLRQEWREHCWMLLLIEKGATCQSLNGRWDRMRCSRTGEHQPAGSVADTARFFTSWIRRCSVHGIGSVWGRKGTEMFQALAAVALQARKHIYHQKPHETYSPASFYHTTSEERFWRC